MDRLQMTPPRPGDFKTSYVSDLGKRQHIPDIVFRSFGGSQSTESAYKGKNPISKPFELINSFFKDGFDGHSSGSAKTFRIGDRSTSPVNVPRLLAASANGVTYRKSASDLCPPQSATDRVCRAPCADIGKKYSEPDYSRLLINDRDDLDLHDRPRTPLAMRSPSRSRYYSHTDTSGLPGRRSLLSQNYGLEAENNVFEDVLLPLRAGMFSGARKLTSAHESEEIPRSSSPFIVSGKGCQYKQLQVIKELPKTIINQSDSSQFRDRNVERELHKLSGTVKERFIHDIQEIRIGVETISQVASGAKLAIADLPELVFDMRNTATKLENELAELERMILEKETIHDRMVSANERLLHVYKQEQEYVEDQIASLHMQIEEEENQLRRLQLFENIQAF